MSNFNFPTCVECCSLFYTEYKGWFNIDRFFGNPCQIMVNFSRLDRYDICQYWVAGTKSRLFLWRGYFEAIVFLTFAKNRDFSKIGKKVERIVFLLESGSNWENNYCLPSLKHFWKYSRSRLRCFVSKKLIDFFCAYLIYLKPSTCLVESTRDSFIKDIYAMSKISTIFRYLWDCVSLVLRDVTWCVQ